VSLFEREREQTDGRIRALTRSLVGGGMATSKTGIERKRGARSGGSGSRGRMLILIVCRPSRLCAAFMIVAAGAVVIVAAA
jgi:hypothetical protein